jgi:hypothetical protein
VLKSTWDERRAYLFRGLNIFSKDETGLKEAEDRFYADGPTPRICLEYSSRNMSDFRFQRNEAIRAIPNVRELLVGVTASALNLLKSDEAPSSPNLLKPGLGPKPAMSNSHKLCLVRRSNADDVFSAVEVSPMSKRVILDILSNIKERKAHAVLDLWRTFSGQNTAGMSGVIFEAYMHLQFSTQIKFEHSQCTRR